MQKKIILLTFLMIALIALAQIPFPVVAYVKEERVLQPISGSNVDARTFYWGSHMIADGFAVTTSMDLPAAVKTPTQTRFGFAVGLGDQWEEQIESYQYRYTPYVDNMWLTIRGDANYSVTSLGSISDNTGTGDPSAIFETIISALSVLFTAYDITNFVSIAYEEPPSEEWQRNEHWATAIVRQTGDVCPSPRLQTACASLMSYFHNHKWNTLNITAEAELCIEIECYGWWTHRYYIATYRSSFEVQVAADEPPQTPSRPSGPTSGYPGSYYTYSSVAIDPEDDNIRYQFDWGDGSITITDWKASGATASASHTWDPGYYYVKVRAQDPYGEWSNWSWRLGVKVESGDGDDGHGAGGCPTLFVWDGSQYVQDAFLNIHADSDVTLQHTIAETLVPNKNSYELSLRELDNFTSHIDQVKLYVVDDDGEMHETHLTNATHSELGDVKEPLLHDDDARVDLTPEQTIDLRFTVPNIDDVAYFMFEINGYNQKTVIDPPI